MGEKQVKRAGGDLGLGLDGFTLFCTGGILTGQSVHVYRERNA